MNFINFIKEWGLPILAILSVFYLFYTLSKKTENEPGDQKNTSFNFNNWNLSSNLLTLFSIVIMAAIFFWFIPSAYPGFWERYSNSDIFLPSILIGIASLIMWHYKDFNYVFVFFGILFIVLYSFGGSKVENKSELQQAKITVIETINGREVIIYEGLTPKTLYIDNAFDVIPQTCGSTINVWSKGWGKGIDAKRDCGKVWTELKGLARTESAVHFTTVE